MLHFTARTLKYFGAIGTCAAFAICTVFVARSEAQGGKQGQPQAGAVANSSQAAPLFGIKIQPGYRDWKLISVAHEEGSLNDIRAILGNHIRVDSSAGVRAASRGNAPKDGTSWLTLSNMKTFMTPDDPYRSAPRTCRTHNSMFIVHPSASAQS